MKLIVAFCLLGVAFAAPPPAFYSSDSKNAEILRYDNDNTGFGSYRYEFEQSDGTKQEQQGQVVNEGSENAYLAVKGRFSYVAPDGVVYTVTFEQSDGTKQQQQGELVKKGSNEYLSVKGSFTYIGLDGVTYTVTYTADDNGYRPEIEQGPGGGVPDAVVASMLG
ncbi:unnamed protein product, partial [Iphiclides podalirius]